MMKTMEYRKFGRLGWQISSIGIGSYAMGGRWGYSDDLISLDTLNLALDSGVNFFDTADIYGEGRSENLFSKAFKGKIRQYIYIATKGGYDFTSNPAKVSKNFDVTYLKKALETSLTRLESDYVDVYQLHGPNVEIIKQGDLFRFLQDMKDAGKIRACGISVYTSHEAKAALSYDVLDSIQYPYNVLEQDNAIDVFTLCAKKNVAVIAREPLAQGLLSGKYSEKSTFPPDDFRSVEWTKEFLNERFERLSRLSYTLLNPRRTMVQAAIKFVLACENISTVIPGARSPRQLQEILTSLSAESFFSDELKKLRAQ